MSYSKRFVTNDPLSLGECKNETCYKPTSKDIKHHTRKEDCWVNINGVVYNVSKYKKNLKEKLTRKENEYYNLMKEGLSTEQEINELNIKHQENLEYINSYQLRLICGNNYENLNEKNIFHKDLDYKNYSIGALKYYKLFKLLKVLLNLLVLVAIAYIIMNKMDNYYIITFILLPLIFYMLFNVYKFLNVYLERQNKVAKTENEINDEKNIKSTASFSITLSKVIEILNEIQQRALLLFLILLLIIVVLIYGIRNKIENLHIILTIISIIVIYILFAIIKTKLNKEIEPRWNSPKS